MDFLFYFVLTIFLILISYGLLYLRRYRHPLRTLPGPFNHFQLLLGNVGDCTKKDFRFFATFQRERELYGTLRSFPMAFGNIGLSVSDPQWIKYILITNGSNYISGECIGAAFFKQAVGENGLVVVNGEQHKMYRKILSPAFKLSTLKTTMPIIQFGGERMINLFHDYYNRNKITTGDFVGSSLIDVKHLFNKATLDIAILFLLGYDLQESCTWRKDTFGHYLWNCLEMQENIFALLSIFDVSSSFIRALRRLNSFLPFGGMEQSRITNTMHDLIEKIIENQINYLQQKPTRENNHDESTDKIKSCKSLLEYMIDTSSGFHLSRQEIYDLIMTFIIGGHETASITLTFILYELSKKPEYQTRLRNEVIKVSKELGDKIEWDDVKKFTFLNACVKESLRMYPPVPWIPRNLAKPDIIDGHYVPAGTFVVAMTSEMHRDPDIWPDPNEFKPERFLEPDETIPWDCWLPFGDGFHKCIGYQFGFMETAYLLAAIVKKFRFSCDANIDYRDFAFVSLNTDPPVKLYVTPL